MSWLLAIGLENAVLVIPLAAAALAAGRLCRRPALAHVLWVIVLVKLVTPPLIDVPVGWELNFDKWLSAQGPAEPDAGAASLVDRKTPSRRETRRAVASAPVQRQSGAPARRNERPTVANPPAVRSQSMRAPLSDSRSWRAAAAVVWLAGSIYFVIVFTLRLLKFHRFVRAAAVRDHELAARVGELAVEVGLKIPPRVVVVSGVLSPMLWGLGRNVRLIFPAKLAARLSPAELDSLLLHELAHYARGDHWIRALELVAMVLYWWNPLVHWARREIETYEEECCDAWVVRHSSGEPQSYAEALLATINFLCERPAAIPPAACGLGEASRLRSRLVQIMRGESSPRLSRAAAAMLLGVGLVASPLQPALFATSSRSVSRSPTPEKTLNVNARVRPLRVSPRASSLPARNDGDRGAAITRAFNAVSPAPALRRPAVLWATAVSPNGKHRLEARVGRRTTLTQSGSSFRLDLSAHGITCASFSPDSRWFATGHEDSFVRLWDSETGGLMQTLRGSEFAIASIHVSPDGKRIAAGARDGEVLVWDPPTGDVFARIRPSDASVGSLRWAPNSDRLAIAFGAWTEDDGQGGLMLVWSLGENSIASEFLLSQPAGAVEWLSEEAIAVAGWDGQASVLSTATDAPITELRLEKDRVSAAAWSADCPLVDSWLRSEGLQVPGLR